MSNTSPFFRRRKIGRASSPPTWACYEQIVDSFDDDGDSDSTSGSDDGEECPPRDDVHSDSEDSDRNGHVVGTRTDKNPVDGNDHAHDMEIDGEGASNAHDLKKDVKGKQRAVEPELDSPKSRKERRPRRTHVETLRPILTIHRSQGFVWNQDLFVPPYIKDRCTFIPSIRLPSYSYPSTPSVIDIASTSPPNPRAFTSSNPNPALTDCEVEVVEIRVREGELNDIIP